MITYTNANDGKTYEARAIEVKKLTPKIGTIKCPWCGTETPVNLFSFSGCGKLCIKPGCGVKFLQVPLTLAGRTGLWAVKLLK